MTTIHKTMKAPATFTEWLRYWRKRRGMSQLDLATQSSISQRHISFMESGRSQPSRDMVLKLGVQLDIPLRQRNAMLLAAGFAPAYHERSMDDPDLEPARKVLNMLLEQHRPFPATVVDRLWNMVMINEPAMQMMHWLLGPSELRAPDLVESTNTALLMMHPNGLRPYIANWEPIAAQQLHEIRQEAAREAPHKGAACALLEALSQLPDLPSDTALTRAELLNAPVQTLTVCRDQVTLNLITTVATLGVAQDITLQDLRAELIYPADEQTHAWLTENLTST